MTVQYMLKLCHKLHIWQRLSAPQWSTAAIKVFMTPTTAAASYVKQVTSYEK